MSDSNLQISRLRISNILGIDELEVAPGAFTKVSGRNGTGKTSVLESIKAAVGGGHDATLLRKGADKGEVVLVLDDGTEITKRVSHSGSKTEVKDADGKKVGKPSDFIRTLTDTLSVNPVEFLRAPKKDRVKVLLEAMPITVDGERLESMAGIPVIVDSSVHGLAVIDMVRKEVFDYRTGTNRAVKEKESSINQLKLALPDAPGGVEGSEDELRAQVTAAATLRDTELNRVRDKLDGIKAENQSKIDAIRTATQAEIDRLKAEADRVKAEALAQVEAIQAGEREWEGKAAIQREKTIQKHTDAVSPLNIAIQSIVSNRDTHARRAQALDTIKQFEGELEELEGDVAAQTKAINDIDAYKLELLAKLPIPGVEVRDGEIYRDNVVFDRLNTAQQVGIAVEIAKLRAGSLRISCVDGLELLDPDAFEAFREQAEASDLQLFVTRVSGEDFSVETTDSAE